MRNTDSWEKFFGLSTERGVLAKAGVERNNHNALEAVGIALSAFERGVLSPKELALVSYSAGAVSIANAIKLGGENVVVDLYGNKTHLTPVG